MKKILPIIVVSFISAFALDTNSTISIPHVEYANPDGMTEKFKVGKPFDYISHMGKSEKGVIYQLFSYKSGNFDVNKIKGIETFFGKRSEYDARMKEQLSANIANGSLRMLSGTGSAIANGTANIGASLGAGAGVGVFVSLLTMTVDTLSKDYEYMRVVSYVDENGKKGKITSLYISSKDNLSHDEIRSIMAKKEGTL